MKQKIIDVTIFAILIVLILPFLLYLTNRFDKLLGLEEHSGYRIGYFFSMCVCLLSFIILTGKRLVWIKNKGYLVGMLLNSMIVSMLMEIYLLGSCYIYLRLVPVMKFSDVIFRVWLLAFIWFFLLAATAFSLHTIMNKKQNTPDIQGELN